MQTKTKVIYNMRLAGYLMQNGFVLIDIEENNDRSGKKVFFFKETEALNKYIEKYFIMRG